MKTVLFIIGTTALGGAPNHTHILLSQLSPIKYKKIVICPNDGAFYNKFEELENTIVYNVNIRKLSVSVIYKIIRIIKTERIDLIHSHGKGAGLYGRISGLFTNVKVIHTFHGIHYHESYSALYNKIYLLYEKIMAIITSYFINVSKSENELAKKLKIYSKNSKSKIIYNAINSKSIEENTYLSISDLVSEDIPKSAFIIGTIANFYYAKGHEFLIEAASKLVEKIPDIRFILIGDGPLFQDQKDLAIRLNVEKEILFLGSKENVFDYLRIMDVFVLCSRWEGMPISMIEAMVLGKPVVGTKVTGIIEMVKDNYNGLLISPESAEEIADAIYYLYLNTEERNRFGVNSKIRAKELFSVNKMTSEVESIYNEVLNET
jgi:glycosyltransferase involved in cell wall biosynthesis